MGHTPTKNFEEFSLKIGGMFFTYHIFTNIFLFFIYFFSVVAAGSGAPDVDPHITHAMLS